jgi:hypothetical protein
MRLGIVNVEGFHSGPCSTKFNKLSPAEDDTQSPKVETLVQKLSLVAVGPLISLRFSILRKNTIVYDISELPARKSLSPTGC